MKMLGPGADVPYISQFDDSLDGSKTGRYCGMACLWMALEYFEQEQQKDGIDPKELKEHGESIGGLNENNDWIHTKLAEVARSHGYGAVVRSWFVRDEDIDNMYEQGRLASESEARAYKSWIESEFMMTVAEVISQGQPVILSVKPGFGVPMYGNGNGGHLVVITAIAEDQSSFLVHDPQCKPGEGEAVEVSKEGLLQFAKFNAIFVLG